MSRCFFRRRACLCLPDTSCPLCLPDEICPGFFVDIFRFYAGFFTYNTLATGCGDTMFVMWNSFVNCIIFRLVLAILFNQLWGVYGVFIACAIAPASSVPIGWFYCRKGYWKKSLTAQPRKS